MDINKPILIDDFVVIERLFITNEHYVGLCVFTSLGHRCGYVGLPEDHSLYGVEDIDGFLIEVHGGITFSGYKDYVQTEERLWWFGFDCGHTWDAADLEFVARYFPKSMDQQWFTDIVQLRPLETKTVRTLEFVIEEVEKLSKQLTPQSLMKTKMLQN